eukprot:COSAG03_NODE_17836_length_367_cov_0.578358_1_plen_23_part_10
MKTVRDGPAAQRRSITIREKGCV